jgi:DNA-binding SARP family transcriptional activator/TolB-like protein
MFEFRALGTTDLRDLSKDQSLARLRSRPKLLALFAYLALSARRFTRRDVLTGVFWPECRERQARHALRQALYELRGLLGEDVVVSRGDALGIDARFLRCDVHAFEAAIEARDFARALELYGGELLPGLHVPGCPELDHWLETSRQRLRTLAVRAATRSALELISNQDFSGAVPLLERGMNWDPYDERLLRELLVCLHHLGDRSRAIHEYETFRARLSGDLAIDPSDETEALVEAVREAESGERVAVVDGLRGSLGPEAPDESTSGTSWWRKSTSPRRVAVAIALAVVLVVLGLMTSRNRAAEPQGVDLESNRVLVGPFVNRTGDPEFDRLGQMASDWIARGLAETDLMRVVSVASLNPGQGGGSESPDDARSLAENHRAALLIIGSYRQHGDSLAFEAQVIDVASGELLRTVSRLRTPASAALEGVDELRQKVAGSLATVVDPRLRSWADRASQPPSYAAYVLYDRGLETLFGVRRKPFSIDGNTGGFASRMGEAAEYFGRAAAVDPDFSIALLWAIQAYTYGGARRRADSLAQMLNGKRNELTNWERSLLDGYMASARGDLPSAYRAYTRVVEMTPGDVWNYNLAETAYRLNRPREAARLLSEADSEQGLLFHFEMFWHLLTVARHRLGEHEEELLAARTGRRVLPGSSKLRRNELRALGALGRVENAMPRDHDEAFILVEELIRHGHHTVAEEVVAGYLARYDPTEDSQPSSNAAYWLEKAGRLDESRAILEGLLEKNPENWWVWRRLGEIAAMSGEQQRAIEIASLLRDWRTSSDERGRATYYSAILSAHLGDHERATQLISRAWEQGWEYDRLDLHTTPYLPQSLRDYPPFRELMRPEG